MARKRILSETAVKVLLAELTQARDAALRFCGEAPIQSEHYRAAGEVADAITRFATIATGDPEHFMPKHLNPPGPNP